METNDIAGSRLMLVSTLKVGGALFGLDTARIQEVVRVGDITPVRGAASYIVGILNLRGRIVTVIDLGLRLGLSSVEIGPASRIAIIDWHGEPVGLLVDLVADVIEVDRDNLEPASSNLRKVDARYIQGVSQAEGRLTTLLNVESILQTGAEAPADAAVHKES